MKKYLLLLFALLSMGIALGQGIPEGFNYQAIARNSDGAPIMYSDIIVEISIWNESGSQLNEVWHETHYAKTNEFGLFTLIIGKGYSSGTGSVSQFKDIDWSLSTYSASVSIDFGSGAKDMGNVSLMSVPYAQVADSALKAPKPQMKLKDITDINTGAITKNQTLTWNGSQWEPGKDIKVNSLVVLDSITINGTFIYDAQMELRNGLVLGNGSRIDSVSSSIGGNNLNSSVVPSTVAVKHYVDSALSTSDSQQLQFDSTTHQLSIENGNQVDLSSLAGDRDSTNEIQDLALNGATLTITGKTGATEINLAPYLGTNTDEQQLTYNDETAVLSLQNGGTVDLSLLKNSDSQILTYDSTTYIISLENGGEVYLGGLMEDADSDPLNELQVLSIANDTIYLSRGGFAVLPKAFSGNYADLVDKPDLSVYSKTDTTLTVEEVLTIISSHGYDADSTNEIQDLVLEGSTLTITGKTGATEINLAPFVGTNTDEQQLSFSEETLVLQLQNGGTVDLSSLVKDADPQNELQILSIVNDTLFLSQGGFVVLPKTFSGNYADLAGLPDLSIYSKTDTTLTGSEVLSIVASGGYITNAEEGDADPQNEIQDLELQGSTLTITGNTNATGIDLSPYAGTNTDEQALAFNDTVLSITNGNSIDLSVLKEDADADSTNELISEAKLVGNELQITDAGGTQVVDFSSISGSITFNTDRNITREGTGATGQNLGGADVSVAQFLENYFFPAIPASAPSVNFSTAETDFPYAVWSTWAGNSSGIDFNWSITNNSKLDDSEDADITSIKLFDGATLLDEQIPDNTAATLSGTFSNIEFANSAGTPSEDFSKTFTLEVKDVAGNTVSKALTLTMLKAVRISYGKPSLSPSQTVYEFANTDVDLELSWDINTGNEAIQEIYIQGQATGQTAATGSLPVLFKSTVNGGAVTQSYSLQVEGDIYGLGEVQNSASITWENRLYRGTISSSTLPCDASFSISNADVLALQDNQLGGNWKSASGYDFVCDATGKYVVFAYPDDGAVPVLQYYDSNFNSWMTYDATNDYTVISRPSFENQHGYTGTDYKIIVLCVEYFSTTVRIRIQ